MKFKDSILALFFMVNVVFASCQNQNYPEVIAEKANYQLTKVHFKKHLSDLENVLGPLSQEEIESEKKILIQMFMDAPDEVLESLKDQASVNPSSLITAYSNVSIGNQKVRDLLGSDIGQMQFDSQAAQAFRKYIASSLFTTKSNNYDSAYNTSNYSESSTRIQFCPDGSFIQELSGYVSIDVEGMSATSGDETDYMPGYWEVASLPKNMFVILFYSTHPSMLEDSPNGILPFPVTQYAANYVTMPNGDGYSRIAHSYCK